MMYQNLHSFKHTLNVQASKAKLILWTLINIIFFKSSIPYPSSFKSFILRLFGASIGKHIVFKPCINIKFPWKLTIGDYSWIGENVWIDNLDFVIIEDNVCISQGAFLLTGNHNYKKQSFDLQTGPIILKKGVWICAMCIVCSNVTCNKNAVLTVGSIASNNLMENTVYSGNPALSVRIRFS
jgi:putative colanic acid biosynthesis acetyltransferase WcaF